MFKRVGIVLWGGGIFSLFLLVCYRSFILDITNDEAYSFKLVHELPHHFSSARNQMFGSANTHWLNSFFLWLEIHLLGTEPWMLRLHCVLAFALFMYALFQFFRKEKIILLFIPFLLLTCNHYLLDFFSLARGYALEMAFELMAILAIFRQKKPFVIYTWLLLSCLANYTNLYLLFAYFILDWVQEGQKNGKLIYINTGFFSSRWILFPFFLWAIPNIYFIKYITKDLEEGRRNNILTDTLGVFLERSYSGASPSFYFILSLILFVGVCAFFIHQRKALSSGWNTLFILFLIILLLIHVFYFFLNTPYPYGRTALGFWVIFLLLISCMFIELLKKIKPLWQASVLLILVGLNGAYLLTHFHIHTTVEWFKQQGMKQWVKDVQQQHPADMKDLKIAMSIDHYGVYDNYYYYLHPHELPSLILVYDRKGYNQIPDSIRNQFPYQDELLLYGDYHAFLDSVVPQPNRQFMKHYEEMETDWWHLLLRRCAPRNDEKKNTTHNDEK